MPTTPAAPAETPRRILATRNRGWARALAGVLARSGVRPNAVSLTGVLFAASAAGFLYVAANPAPGAEGLSVASWLCAAACVQLRLLCNLLDGMLAVEQGLKSKTGELYNDLPDRVADVLILTAAGYSTSAAFGPILGWTASVLALFTAYVRVLAGSLGLTQHFIGPMAKQHRMFTLTLASLGAATEVVLELPPRVMTASLVLIVLGSAITTARRASRVAAEARLR